MKIIFFHFSLKLNEFISNSLFKNSKIGFGFGFHTKIWGFWLWVLGVGMKPKLNFFLECECMCLYCNLKKNIKN